MSSYTFCTRLLFLFFVSECKLKEEPLGKYPLRIRNDNNEKKILTKRSLLGKFVVEGVDTSSIVMTCSQN